MKITERLDEISKEYPGEKPFIPRKVLAELLGENFFKEAYKSKKYHVFFEEDKALYHITILRETILKEYSVLKRNGKLYEKVSDAFIDHLIKQEKDLEEKLSMIKKITDHSSVRLKKIFKKNE